MASVGGEPPNSNAPYLAHTKPDAPAEIAGHLLEDHLRAVAELSAGFARSFGSREWGRLAGLWHDLGKYRPGFQRYIRQSRDPDAHIEGRVVGRDKTHSAAGALHAIKTLGPGHGSLLAFLIAGHHAGLPDHDPSDGAGASLKARLASDDSKREYAEATQQRIPADILDSDKPEANFLGGAEGFALWIRVLFSCLVDADFLDTEAYFNRERTVRRARHSSVSVAQVGCARHLELAN